MYMFFTESIGYTLNNHSFNSQVNMMDNSMVSPGLNTDNRQPKDAAGGSLETRKTLSLS